MSSAFTALVRGWWVRFFLRNPPSRPQPASPPARPAAAPAAVAPVVSMAPTPSAARPVAKPAFVPVAQPVLRERTLQQLAGLQQIPALQSLAQGFQRAARTDGSVEEVVAAVEKDQALCVRVLRLANSVYVSPDRPIDDVFSAVQMLGLQRVSTLAQALFMLRDNQSTGGVDWKHLWVHALATSSLADEVQHHLGRPADPQLHLAALLHDVGKIVLSTVEPDTYRKIINEVWNETGRLDALEAINFGLGHAEAGMVFAQQSRLPELVVATIAHHADPAAAGPHRLPVAVVSLANYFSKLYGLGFSGSRVDGTDEELRSQPGWAVIHEETGFEPDIAAVAAGLDSAAVGLKHELLELQRTR